MTEVSRTTLLGTIATNLPDNTSAQISPADLRNEFINVVDSVAFKSTQNTVPPTANDDISGTGGNGTFAVGDTWIDETNNIAYVCVDNTATTAIWNDIAGSADNTLVSGTPVDNQLAVWTASNSIEGDSNLTWDGATLALTGTITVTGTVDGRDLATDGVKLDSIEAGAERSTPDIISVSASRNLLLTDERDILEIDTSGGAVVVTIPTNASVAFPIGTTISMTLIDATATATLAGDVGVTLNGISAGSGNLNGSLYDVIYIYKRATDEWIVSGDIGVVA